MPLSRPGQPSLEEPRCIEESEHPLLMLDFLARDGRIHGFPYSQLTNYQIDSNPALERRSDAPAERLTLLFSTHDVILTGWRLHALRPLLHSARLAALRAADLRYAHVARNKPFIAEITVNPISASPSPALPEVRHA
ncbi:MAG: hypothetical protein ABMA01_20620 [Chthoniobacteraceae bacterium]